MIECAAEVRMYAFLNYSRALHFDRMQHDKINAQLIQLKRDGKEFSMVETIVCNEIIMFHSTKRCIGFFLSLQYEPYKI